MSGAVRRGAISAPRARRAAVVLVALVAALVALVALSACHKKDDAQGARPDDAVTIVVTDASLGLLLTWIDDKGDFHVEQKVTDVPLMGRDTVRVVDPSKDEGTHGDRIVVADLRAALPDGTYRVTTMTRADFDALALDRRKAHAPTLATVDGDGSAPQPAASAGAAFPDPGAGNRPPVIIYGAEWCGPCHQAQAYLRSRGIPFVEKDVDNDHDAQREMQAKLRGAGLRAGSIPVMDVRGKILVGFSPRAVDDALGAAL